MKHSIRLLLSLLLFIQLPIYAKDKKEPKLTINFLSNDKIADVNLNQDSFIQSVGHLTDYCKEHFAAIPDDQKIGILVTAHTTGNATIKVFSDPDLNPTELKKIQEDLNAIKIEPTKLVDFSFFVSINSNATTIHAEFDFLDPEQQKIQTYKDANIATKIRLNKEYAIQEVIPVLAAYQVIVEDKFSGVKNMGKLLKETDFHQPVDIEKLTDHNQYFWRANMEMNTGNQLIPVSKIYALVAQGEFDYAKKYIEILRIFSDPKSVANDYLEAINFRLNLLDKDVNAEIEKGISLHDAGKYEQAIDVYNQLLKKYPTCSWALYERYYSENSLKLLTHKTTGDNREDWDLAKKEIYRHNPLYNMDVRATTGKEAYLLFRRQEVSSLFKQKEDRMKDIFTYAEIATDLSVYDFAAELFWLSANFGKDQSQESIYNYLYCLEKMGVTNLKYNFKGDFEKIFKKIEEQKQKDMLESPIYKSMKNEE